MDSVPVIEINYSDASAGPWPKILKILAIVTLAFGLLSFGRELVMVSLIRPWGAGPRWYVDIWAVSSAMSLVMDLLLTAGALRLLVRPGAYRLIVLASWAWIIASVIGEAAMSFRRSMGFSPQTLAYSLLRQGVLCVPPALIIALIRQYRKEQQVVPQRPALAELSPTAHDPQAAAATLR